MHRLDWVRPRGDGLHHLRREPRWVPRGRHNVCFARSDGLNWGLGEAQSLPEGMPATGVWQSYELTWDDGRKHLVLKAAGKVLLDYALRKADRLDGPFSIGTGMLAKMRIRKLMLRNEQ